MGVMFHFLNVGPGDCTIVHFPARTRKKDGSSVYERIMVVDICHDESQQGYSDVIAYYKQHFTRDNGSIKPIFRFVCTHPHQDHICGLANLFENSGIDVVNFWDLEHEFEPEELDKHPTHEADWGSYVKTRKSTSSPKVIRTKREDTPAQFWNDDEDRVTVLSPSDTLIKYAHYTQDGKKRKKHEIEIDEMSYAFMIQINSRKVILAGDGRATPLWQDIYDNCKLAIAGCAVLKAGHHGQEAAFHEDSVKLMDPSLVIFSNSSEEDAEYGAQTLYAKAVPNALILKTCDVGTIQVKVPFNANESITYWTEAQ